MYDFEDYNPDVEGYPTIWDRLAFWGLIVFCFIVFAMLGSFLVWKFL